MKITVTCSRCRGSGNYSFNLLKGTVCFGCGGSGYKLVDEAKHEAAIVRKQKADTLSKLTRERRAIIAAQVKAELEKEFGFLADTDLAMFNLVSECQRVHKCTPGDIVQQRLAAK